MKLVPRGESQIGLNEAARDAVEIVTQVFLASVAAEEDGAPCRMQSIRRALSARAPPTIDGEGLGDEIYYAERTVPRW